MRQTLPMPDKPQLYLLHFAGGNSYSFQFLKPYFDQYDFIPLELPGRGKRMREPLLRDFEAAADDIFRQIDNSLKDSPFLIYGHSMGAYLGLRVAGRLEMKGRVPMCLVVSGNAGPGADEDVIRHLLEKDEFRAELKKLGGVPREFFNNEDLLDFFEPILRADFELNEKIDFTSLPPVHAPVYAIMGDKEPTAGRIDNWKNYTVTDASTEILPGDHFFIYDHAKRLAEIITACFSSNSIRSNTFYGYPNVS
jgi:external thioesterase TEII